MRVTDELLLRKFDNFFLVHAASVESFGTSNTLKNRHCVSTYSADVAVMKRTSEVQ
jgi:hypothetical protein